MRPDELHEDLSPAERRAFDALPREAPAPDAIEERTVAALRSRGDLPIPVSRRQDARAPRVWWMTGAIAAALAVFASGVAVGQYLGAHNAVLVVRATSQASAAELAAHLQRTGTDYVAALTALGQLSDTANSVTRARARQAAISILASAAEEIARFAPDDPLAAAVLRGLNQRDRQSAPDSLSRSVVWY
jgi:hypothetical protein